LLRLLSSCIFSSSGVFAVQLPFLSYSTNSVKALKETSALQYSNLLSRSDHHHHLLAMGAQNKSIKVASTQCDNQAEKNCTYSFHKKQKKKTTKQDKI